MILSYEELFDTVILHEDDPLYEGSFREVHATTDHNYVVKMSKMALLDGALQNKAEYVTYQKLPIEMKQFFPEFKAVTPCGQILLVERCISFEMLQYENHLNKRKDLQSLITDLGLEEDTYIQDIFYDLGFTEVGQLCDLHSDNWGFTLDENPRLVILDMAPNEYSQKDLLCSQDIHYTEEEFKLAS